MQSSKIITYKAGCKTGNFLKATIAA